MTTEQTAPARRDLPRTRLEVLYQIDTMLADAVPLVDVARDRIIRSMPGHSGRPAGNGDPPGGSGGGGGTSPTERVALASGSVELRDLARLDRAVDEVLAATVELARSAGLLLPGQIEQRGRAGRRVAWSRWAVRCVIDAGAHVRRRPLDDLWSAALVLSKVVRSWAAPTQAPTPRSADLAADGTEMWCRSHLRVGHREPRSDRYPTDGVCRPCGDFHAEHGWWPTLEIIDAMIDGRHIDIARLTREEHATRRAAKSRKRRRR